MLVLSPYLLHLVELFLGHVPFGVAQLAKFLPRRVKVRPRRRRRYHVTRILWTLHERVVQPAILISSHICEQEHLKSRDDTVTIYRCFTTDAHS